ncbi:transcriptional regulator/sugar kinase [Candidatus Omnitrophus magneticus]|uniref:Transcriptional regulator/sugar kinase n=1 Tax=Candidatus Omnitrophus magneticus TaxID=1609969 RepID=A0A0F0CT73_9BACT|nr:transcriptional regulator/sugar kinase [Candidatus Omnitrophus magneticus]
MEEIAMKNFLERAKEERLSEKERRNLSIFDAIRRGKEISRAEISRLTDLNIVTVSNYVSKYIKDNIVFETGLDISSGGRRPELLKLNTESAYSIGIDLGAQHLSMNVFIVAVILDINGKIVAKEKIKKESESFEKLSLKVLNLVERLIAKSGISQQLIKGICVGIWGVIDRYRGMVRYAIEEESIVSYTGLLEQLENTFNLPVKIEHDALLAAFGEKWAGGEAISASNNIIFMCADSSCGIVIKGELYYGASKSAGELNLSPPRYDVETSKDKCWTNYDFGCCMRSRGLDLGIPQKIKIYLEEHNDKKTIMTEMAGGDIKKIDFDIVVNSAEQGDEIAKKFLEDAGDYMGAKAAFLINLFNPEVIVVGRGIERAGDIFFSAIRKAVRRWAYEESVKIVKILPASLGEDAVSVGAAGLVTQEFFANV